MTRTVLGSLVFVLLTGFASAAEIKSGTVTKIDTEKNTITVSIDGKDQTYNVTKDVSVTTIQTSRTGRRGRNLTQQTVTLADGIKALRVDTPVSITIETKDDRTVVSQISLSQQQSEQPQTGGRRRRR